MKEKEEKRREDCPKWIARGLLTAALLIFMWAVYPGYVFHNDFLSGTNSINYKTTDTLSDSVSVTQYFVPQLPWLRSIQFASEFEDKNISDESIAFVLCEESGKEICSQSIPLSSMKSGLYYDVKIGKKLKPGQTYFWRVSAPMEAACGWKMMYTELQENQAPENSLFLVGENLYGSEGAQTVSQYGYYIHYDKATIIGGYWLGGFIVYLAGLELINRIFKKTGS